MDRLGDGLSSDASEFWTGWYGTNHSTVGVFERFIQSCCRLALVRVSAAGMATRKIASCIAAMPTLLDAAGIRMATLRLSASSRSMKTSTRSIFGMLRLVSLTRKRFASGRFRSCDEWMFGVNFRQAGSSSIWITSGLPVTRHRAQPARNPVILTVSVARRKMRSLTENLNLFRKNRETFTSRLTSDNRSQ